MELDDLTQRVIVGAASPAELVAWQTTEEGQALLDEPRTAGAFEQALERAVREARGPARRAVCETLLTQGFEHIIGRVLSRCSRDELRMFEPELRRKILGVETESDLEDLLRRALGPAPPGTRKPGPLVGAALLRIAAEDDPARMERLVEVLRLVGLRGQRDVGAGPGGHVGRAWGALRRAVALVPRVPPGDERRNGGARCPRAALEADAG